jgi:NAD(P)H-dependent flavin oxidoreductase YrpB (nitropropane dioxygenase family)
MNGEYNNIPLDKDICHVISLTSKIAGGIKNQWITEYSSLITKQINLLSRNKTMYKNNNKVKKQIVQKMGNLPSENP